MATRLAPTGVCIKRSQSDRGTVRSLPWPRDTSSWGCSSSRVVGRHRWRATCRLALVHAGWSVELVTGSLGDPGEETHAPTFFAGTPVQHLDYSDAVRAFAAGGSAVSCSRADAPVVRRPRGRPRRGVLGGARRARRAPVVGLGDTVSCRWGRPRPCLPPSSPDAAARRGRALLAPGCRRRPPPRHRDQVPRGGQRARRTRQVGGNDAGRHARMGTGQPGRELPARRSPARAAANDPLGAMGAWRGLARSAPPSG